MAFLARPSALSRSGMPFSSPRKGPIRAPRLEISSTASSLSLMSGMLRSGRQSHCLRSRLPPAHVSDDTWEEEAVAVAAAQRDLCVHCPRTRKVSCN